MRTILIASVFLSASILAARAGGPDRGDNDRKASLREVERHVRRLDNRDIDVLEETVTWLRAHPRETALYMCKNLKAHPRDERRAAIPLLAQIDHRYARIALAMRAVFDEDGIARERAVDAVRRCGGRDARDYVIAKAAKGSPETKYKAARAIAAIADKSYVPPLINAELEAIAGQGHVRTRYSLDTLLDQTESRTRVTTHPNDGAAVTIWDIPIMNRTTERIEGEATAWVCSLVLQQDFGTDRDAWRQWWKTNRDEFTFPDPAEFEPDKR